MKVFWSVLLVFVVALLVGSLSFAGSAPQIVAAKPITAVVSPVNTLNVPTLSVGPADDSDATPTKERFSLTRTPTEEPPGDVAEPLLTLTALNEIANNQPTPTDGPSEIIMDGKPHFVDFNAWWCSPCNQMRPSVLRMKDKYGEWITFDDINVDNRASAGLNRKYRVEFIPLMVLLDKNGKEVKRLEGYQTEQDLDDALAGLLESQ
jgi:thioredoxin 1